MFGGLQILTLLLVAIAMAPALAHAFEFPGKKRLDKDDYIIVQAIYYPGFTLLGIAEPAAVIAAIILLAETPAGSPAFWPDVIAMCGLLGMQVIYWSVTHPTNRYWLQGAGAAVGNAGSRFFSIGTAERDRDWTRLRDRWEYSHIARAVLAFLSFVSLALAIVLSR